MQKIEATMIAMPNTWARALDADDDLGISLLPVAITNIGPSLPSRGAERSNDARARRWAARARPPILVEARA